MSRRFHHYNEIPETTNLQKKFVQLIVWRFYSKIKQMYYCFGSLVRRPGRNGSVYIKDKQFTERPESNGKEESANYPTSHGNLKPSQETKPPNCLY